MLLPDRRSHSGLSIYSVLSNPQRKDNMSRTIKSIIKMSSVSMMTSFHHCLSPKGVYPL